MSGDRVVYIHDTYLYLGGHCICDLSRGARDSVSYIETIKMSASERVNVFHEVDRFFSMALFRRRLKGSRSF